MNTKYNKMFVSNQSQDATYPEQDEFQYEEETNETSEPTNNESELPKPKRPSMAMVVNCKALNVREKATINSKIVRVVKEGSMLEVEDICDGWARVYTETGMDGYVMEKYIEV